MSEILFPLLNEKNIISIKKKGLFWYQFENTGILLAMVYNNQA